MKTCFFQYIPQDFLNHFCYNLVTIILNLGEGYTSKFVANAVGFNDEGSGCPICI